jgi:flagellar biosynthesis protein FlgN
MNNNNNTQSYIAHLEQEIKWVDQLNKLLADEKSFLATRQFNQLEAIAIQKEELSNQLEDSARQRMTIVNQTSASSSISDFTKNLHQTDGSRIKQLNETLAEKLVLCRELNMVNGQVITHNLYTRQEIVNALSGNHPNAAGVYTATGNVKGTSNTSHHEEA